MSWSSAGHVEPVGAPLTWARAPRRSLTKKHVRAILSPVKLAKGVRTRTAILEQAIQLASVVGLDGLSLGDLAARMHLSKSGLYAHFGSKDALQLAILREGTDRFRDIVVADALRRPTGADTIRAVFDGWLRWAHDRLAGGCLFVTASVEFDDRPGPVRDALVDLYGQFLGIVSAAARRAAAAGQFRRDLDLAQFTHDFNAILLGFNHADRLFHDPDAERHARHALERLLKDAQV
jgi:AcrR family transcriptional regulator